jgi:UDP-glucose 4-epimerase
MAGSTKYVLVTGGAGYIGSHTVLEILNSGLNYQPVVIDNLANAKAEAIKRVEKISGKNVIFEECNILDKDRLKEIFSKYSISAVIHFAALKAVGESMKIPLDYYKVNVTGTLCLLEVMKECGVRNIIFSSSATVYGTPSELPVTEDHPTGQCSNTYGRTKYFVEEILKDVWAAEKKTGNDWNVILLRYFNPVGAHESGEIGEDPQGIPNNLMPYVSQVAVGRRQELTVYGNDYDTPDGTGVRDYIHIVDLASGHVAALKKVEESCGLKVYNLGSGKGYSVLEIVRGVEKASEKKIPYKIAARRPGDVAVLFADPSLAEKELNWKAKHGIDEFCRDAWNWQSKNPNGFRE